MASPASALLNPVSDYRFTETMVNAFGLSDWKQGPPSAPFSYFDSVINSIIENPDPNGAGSCQANAFQNSQFHPTLIQASGGSSGYWSISPGNYSAGSIAGFRFRLDTCVQYSLDVWLEPGTLPEALQLLLEASPSRVNYHDFASGEHHVTGRLSPGEYRIEGRSSGGSFQESFDGGTYAYFFQVSPCPGTLIAGQPASVTIPPNTNAVFTVTPQSPSASWTYQWRRNGGALANSSHISGATSTQLTVNAASAADSGYYDVVVNDGPISEPSTPAKLTIIATTGVEPELAALTPLQIGLAGPSPFTGQTTLRYSAPHAQPAIITIHDITGARIHTLAERVVGASGVVAWDGRTSAGARAPAGVYYARIESASGRATCRLVKLN